MADITLSYDYHQIATLAAQQYGVPTSLFLAQINQESGFNPYAQNGNATGIAQFMPGTAAQFGINPADPVQSLYAAAKYDAQLFKQYGTWEDALTHYGTINNSGVPASVNANFYSMLNDIPNGRSGTGGSSYGGIFQDLGNSVSDFFLKGLPGYDTGSHQFGSTGKAVTDFLGLGNIDWQKIFGTGAVFLVGLIMLAGALYLFGTNQGQTIIKELKGA